MFLPRWPAFSYSVNTLVIPPHGPASPKKTVASREVSGRQILQLAKKFRLKIQNCLSINSDCRTNNTTLNPSLFPYCLRGKWPINPLWVNNHFS